MMIFIDWDIYKYCIIKCFGYKIDFLSMKYKLILYIWYSFIVFKSFK